MLIDVLLALGSNMLAVVLGVLPTISFTLPTAGLTWLASWVAMANQVVPCDVIFTQLGIVVGLRAGLVIWYGMNTLWKRLPVLGHGAV